MAGFAAEQSLSAAAPVGEGITHVEDHSRNIYHAGTEKTPIGGTVVEDHSRNIFFGARDTVTRLTDRGRTPQRVRLALE